jgi:D-aminopeptidase
LNTEHDLCSGGIVSAGTFRTVQVHTRSQSVGLVSRRIHTIETCNGGKILSGDVEAKLAACRVTLPEQFTYEVNYKDLKKAYQMSFYPGMKAVDARTNRFTSKNWMDIVTAHSFVVY